MNDLLPNHKGIIPMGKIHMKGQTRKRRLARIARDKEREKSYTWIERLVHKVLRFLSK